MVIASHLELKEFNAHKGVAKKEKKKRGSLKLDKQAKSIET